MMRTRSQSRKQQKQAIVDPTVTPTKHYEFILVPIILLSVACLLGMLSFYIIEDGNVFGDTEIKQLRLPKTMEDVSRMHKLLSLYIQRRYWFVACLYMAVYVFLQSFAIPGSIPLAILGGALFETKMAALMTCMSTGIGASCCYLISRLLASHLLNKYFSNKLNWWKLQIQSQKSHLFSYIFILRLTPIFPGWFLNVAAPHVQIPLHVFTPSTIAGILPTTIIYSQAGHALAQLSTGHDIEIFSNTNLLILFCIGFLALAPRFLFQSPAVPPTEQKGK